MISYLEKGLEELGIGYDSEKIELLNLYLSEIIKWNKVINITAIEDEKDIIIKHFLDSIASAKFINYAHKKVIDIGTGAGFPGLPLKIMFPQMEITFLDSSKKKMMVLDSICKSLGIQQVNIFSDNIESAAHNTIHRERYDLVVCRALANFNILLEYGIPFIQVHGRLVVYKGPNINEEVDNSAKALDNMKAIIAEKHEIILPFSDYKRTIVEVEKVWITDTKYPRRNGIPKKRPL
jgi:16S rRNA (guanine527-N7)-methyltransferase